MTPTIELQSVSFVRDAKPILDHVSWRIEPGQHWALLGANGSGKTTLLKIVSGYEWPTSGQVSVMGHVFGRTDVRELRKTIGWVSNALADRIPGHYTSRQVVASGLDANLRLYRAPTTDEWKMCDDSLRRVGVSELTNQSFQTLSQGEQQRVRIARALVCRPSLLILDEPCAGLDPVSRRDFLNDVARFSASDNSPTIILVTHHVEEIGDWITDCMILRDGSVAAAGTCEEVLTSAKLSAALGEQCVVERSAEGWRLEIAGARRR